MTQAGALDRNHLGRRQRFVRGIFSQRLIQFATGADRTVTLDQIVDSQQIGLDTHQCHSGERVCDNQLSHAIHPLHQRCETVQRWACGLFVQLFAVSLPPAYSSFVALRQVEQFRYGKEH